MKEWIFSSFLGSEATLEIKGNFDEGGVAECRGGVSWKTGEGKIGDG